MPIESHANKHNMDIWNCYGKCIAQMLIFCGHLDYSAFIPRHVCVHLMNLRPILIPL